MSAAPELRTYIRWSNVDVASILEGCPHPDGTPSPALTATLTLIFDATEGLPGGNIAYRGALAAMDWLKYTKNDYWCKVGATLCRISRPAACVYFYLPEECQTSLWDPSRELWTYQALERVNENFYHCAGIRMTNVLVADSRLTSTFINGDECGWDTCRYYTVPMLYDVLVDMHERHVVKVLK
jgi:hypothetical protein